MKTNSLLNDRYKYQIEYMQLFSVVMILKQKIIH